MKKSRFLLSTLFAAAALSVAPAVPALADGDGSQSNPYTGSVGGLTDMFDSSKFAEGSTVYINGITAGYFGADNIAYTCVADINIGSSGMTLTNGYSEASYTFSGKITGTGNWTFSNSSVSQDYIFLGDMSGYSGNIDYSGERHDNTSYPSYFYFGNGGQAATDTNVSGTGSITHNETVIFNYSGYATQGSTAITIGNSSITAEYLTFTGSVNYNISSALKGTGGSSSSLTISTSGTVTLSGDVSDFASVTVSSNSTLAFDGSVSIGSTITNSGTVTLNSDVIFVLDDMSFTGDWSTGATYTLVTGGTINIGTTTLTYGSTLSFGMDNLYVALGTIDSFTFNYDGTSLTVTVTGEEIVNGLNGDGTIDSPYFTYGDGTVSIADGGSDGNIFTAAGTTLYLATDTYSFGNSSENVYLNGTLTAECNIVIGKAGVYLTNATSSQYYNFTGSISGTGNWTHTKEGATGNPAVHYAFAGDLSGWSGDISISTNASSYDIIIYGGTINGVENNAVTGVTGVTAATDTNVSGTGSVSVVGTVQFNYVKPTAGATGYDTLTIGNSSITANSIVFAGDVDYVISAGTTITSGSSSGSFTVSTPGTVTILGTLTTGNTSNCFSSLSVAEGSTLRIGADNTFYTDTTSTSGDVFVVSGTLEVAEDVSFTVRKRTAATGFSVADLSLENGSTFTLFTEGSNAPSASNQGISVGTLTVDGSTKIATSNWHNYVGIGTLIGEAATLTLDSTAGSNSATIFELGGSNTSSQFTGTITLAEDATGDYRGVTLIISDEKVASGAVIEMGTEYNTNDSIALGVNASRVEIAGLVSSNSGGDIVYSGYVSLGATFGDGGATLIDYSNQSGYGTNSNYDGVGTTTNTLVINVADGASYSFSGVFLDKVNIEKGDKGTQSIEFKTGTYQTTNYFDGSITVTGGTLNLSGVAISTSGISVKSGATLSIANQITLASNSSSTVLGNLTVTGEGSLSVSSGATLDLSGATVSLSSTITNSGTVTVNSSTVFLIDDLTGGVSNTYTLISGTIDGWEDLTDSNFFTETRATITVGDNGTITYSAGATSLVWNGNTGDVWQLEGDNVWLNGSNSADVFYNDDTVTFNSSTASSTVIVSGTVKPGSITVNSNYTFTVASGDTALIDTSTLTIASDATLTIDKGVTIYFDIGTVTTFSISGIAGTGTLEFEFNTDYSSTVNLGTGSTFAGEIYITSGNVQLENSAIGSGSFRLVSGVNAQVSSNNAQVSGLIIEGSTTLDKLSTYTGLSITSLVLEDSSTLVFNSSGSGNDYNPSNSNQGLSVGTLTLSGSSATIQTSNWQNYVGIGALVGTGATLNLDSTSSSTVATIYELSGSNASSQFTGTISLSDTNTGAQRGVTLIISDEKVAAGAVIEMGSELSSDTLALGVNASTVEIAGLVSGGSGNNGADVVYSGCVSLGTELGNAGHDFTNSSGTHYGIIGNDGTGTYANVGTTTNTLVINVADGASYSFTGVFLDKLNIEKKGKGTQAINFEDESYFDGKITVSAGTLSISGSVGASEITVADGANLELTGDITLSSTVTNSGTVSVSDSVVFILDNLSGVETGEGTVYTIISGGTIVGWDNLADSNFVTGSHATVTIGTGDAAGTVTIVEGFAADLIWNATVDMVWDRTTKNWLNNGSQDKFAEHDSVTFTSTGQGTVTVENDGVIANIVTVSSGTYSFTGGDITAESFVIESGATVSLRGSLIYSDFVVSGTLKLDTQIDGGYSGEIYGAITIDNGGRVELNVGDATGWEPGYGVTGITVNSGGTLYVGTDYNQTLGGCTLTLVGGTVTGVENSNIDIYTNSSVIVRATSDATAENPTVSTVKNTTLTPRNDGGGHITEFDIGENAVLKVESGIVAGAQGAVYNWDLAKTGAGTLEVTGLFALNEGKLDIQEGSVVLEGTADGLSSWGYYLGFASAVTISAGASLEMNLSEDTVLGYYTHPNPDDDNGGSDSFVASCSITGSGNFIKSGDTTLTVSNYGVTGSTTVSAGTLILSGDSTIGGTVTIAGTLEVASGASLTLEGTLGGSDSTGTVTFAESSTLILSDSFLGSGIEITVDENGTTSVTSGGTITIVKASTVTFGNSSTALDSDTLNDFINGYVSSSSNYTLEWAYSDGALTATITYANVTTYLLPTTPDSSDTPTASSGVLAAGYYIIDPRESNESKQGWISPVGTSGGATSSNISFKEGSFFYGEGLLGISFRQGSSSTVEYVDLTNVDASNLKGQLIVVNEWDNEADVWLSGDSWANVEFLFGGVTDEEELAEKYGLTDITRGDLKNDNKSRDDYLVLQGDTTFAGVTGTTKGFVAGETGGDLGPIVISDHEFITVASSGTTLTIAGSEEYSFWGTVGTNSTRATISMTGSGAQTFGGTNYLQHVFVSDGNLIIAGNTDVASTTTVSGGTLTVGCSSDDEGQSVSFNSSVTVQTDGTLAIAGTVYFSEVVSNSGTVTIDTDSATFVVDNLTMGTSGETSYYEIISGSGEGTIDASGISINNFTGGEVTSQWAVGVSGGSLYIYYTVSEEVVWNGNETTNSWTTDQNVLDWRAGSASIAFTEGEDVTFGSTATNKTVSIAEAIVAGAVKVTAVGYVFDFTEGGSVTASGLTVESSASLELTGTGTLTVVDSLDISDTITVDAGASIDLTSFELGSLADYGSANILGTGTIIVAGVSGNNVGITLNEDFAGTLRVTTGHIDFGTGYSSVGTGVTLEFVAGDDTADTSLCMQATGTEVKNNVVVTGDSGTMNLRGGSYTGVVISGTLTSSEENVTVEKYGDGDLTFTNTVNVAGTYYAYQGTTYFAGDSTTIGSITMGATSSVIYFTGTSATVTSISFNGANSEVYFSGSGKYTVSSVSITEGLNSVLGGTVTIGSMSDTSGNTFTFAKNSNITISEFLTSPSGGTNIALEEGAQLTVGTLTSNWGTSFTLAEGSVIETTSASFLTGSTDTVSGSGTWIATEFTFGNGGTYIFDGVSLIADTVTMTGNNGATASLTLTGGGTFTIGSYGNDTSGTAFAIGDNTTVDVGTFSVSWHQETTTLGNGAVLNVTTELSLHTDNSEEFTGGTINAEKLNVYHSSSASFSNGILNIGSGGIVSDGDSTTSCYVAFGDNLTVGVYAGTSSTATTGWIASAAIQFTGTGSGTTFVTNASESITLSGSISGEGSLTKTGSGTLTISGTNTSFAGSITLAEGTLAIGNSSALGLSTLTLGEGTVLTSTSDTVELTDQSYIIAGNVTISNITLNGGSVSDWAAGAQVTLSGDASVSTSGSWSITFADDTDFTYDGVILFTGVTGVTTEDLAGWTASYNGEGSDSFGTGTFKVDTNGNIIFVASDDYLGVYASLVWDVDSAYSQTWTEGTFQNTTGLSEDRNYIFNEKSAGATSTLSGTITTSRVTIASGAEEITWTTETSDTSISGTDLNIEVGATLNFTPGTGISDFALNFTNISLSGTLVYAGAAVTWDTVTFGYNTASLTLDTTGAITITNLVADTDGAISSTGGTLTISNLSGTGDVTIGGTSTGTVAVSLGDIANYSGTISLVDDGTGSLKLTLTGNTYDDNGQVTFSIGSGTTLDLNGIIDTSFNVVLAGGTLTSAGDIGESNIQVPNISLTADSTIDTGSHSFGMLAREFAATSLDLGGNTLTKAGSGTFFLYNTVITGAGEEEGSTGTILVTEGTLKMESVTATNTSVSVSEGASLTVTASSNGSTTTTTTLVSLDSAGSVEVASNYTLGITGNSTISGSLVLNNGSTLAVSGTNVVVDLTGVTSSQAGGSGTLIISDGATVKVSNLAHGYGGRTTSFGSDMFNGLLQIADGGVLEVTEALDSSDEKSGKRGFSITSGTGTYRYSGTGTSYIVADGNRNIHLANDATLVFDVVEAESVLDVSMLIANGMSSTGDVGDSATTSTGSLQKTGAGTLVISGSNLYSGGTTISAGTLKVQSNDALGTGSITIEEGGTLALDNTSITFTLAKISGTGTLVVSEGNKLSTSGENLALSGDTNVEDGAELDVTIASGTTELATTIEVEEGGTLAMTATSGDASLSTNVAVDAGGTFTLTSSATTTVSGEITVADADGFTANITAGTTTISGEISGDGTLTKTGSGTLVLGSNVSIANIAMSEGTLSGFTLSTGMTATVSGGTLDSFTVADGGTLVSETAGISVTGDVTLSGGTISISGSSSDAYFTVASDASVTISGAVTFDLTDVSFSSSGAAIVIFDSGVTFDNVTVDDLILGFGGSSTGGDPHFSDETGFKWDEDSGSLSVVIEMKSIDIYWEGSTETGGNILAAEGAEVLHDGNNAYTFFREGDTIYFDGSKTIAVSEVTLGSDINAAAIIVQNGAEITLDSDSGTYALVGEGTLTVGENSSLTLTNAKHSYTGETTVNGSLTLGITEASGSGQMFASVVSGSGSLTLDIAEDLTISIADNLTGDEDQLITGSLTFVKSGSGTLVVDAEQTSFTGEVQITGGTMVIASSGLFGENATITIDEDGTLEISADIDSLTETLTGAGTLLVDENLTLVVEATNIAGLSGTTALSDGAILKLNADTDTTTLSGAITGSNATLVKTGSGAVNLASGTTVSTINLTAGTLGNVALSDGMTLTTTQGTTLSSVSMTGGTLTAAKGTTISGITMEGGTLDATNVFEVTTDSITLSGENSFSGGTVLLGEGTLLEDGVQSDPIVAAFVIESDGSVSVSDSIVFSIDNVDLPDAVFDDEGQRIYTISYQVFDTTDGTLEGWTDLIYSNFAIDGVVLSGSERARVELADDGSVKFYLTDYDLTWNGGESGVWNTSDVVWTRDEGVYTEAYDNGDSVTFTSEFGKLNITLGGDVNPMTLTVDKDADVTIIGGEYKITGSKTTIVIEENGKLTLTSGGNDFGGGVTIGDGGELALKVSSNEAYLDGVTIALAEDATSGTFTIDTDIDATYETIFTGTLTDSENLTLVKDGSGTLTITSALKYENLDLEVKSGTLKIATEGSVGSVDINLSGSANLELENTDTETAKEITNSISGVGTATTIVKTGEGEIIIDGDNSGFSGSVEIYEGTLTLKSADALGSVTKTTIAEDGTLKLAIESDFDLDDIVGTVSGSGTIEIDLGNEGTLHATSGYYGSDKFADFTGSFVVHGGDDGVYTMEIDVSSTSQGSAIGDSNIEIDENVNLVFNIQNAGYSYSGDISGSGTVSFNWDSTSLASHTFSLTGDNSNFSGTIYIPEDIVLTAKGGNALGGEDATVENSGELWIDEDDKSSVVSKLTGSGSLHKTGSGAVKIYNAYNDLSGDLEIRGGALCFVGTAALGEISTASVSEGATFELEVDNDSDNEFNVTVSGEGSVVVHGYYGNCIITTYALEHFDDEGYSTDTVNLAKNSSSSYNGGLRVDSAYLITSKTSSYDSMNELGTSTITITNNSTWDASNGGFTASGSRTITIENHSRLLAGAFKAESGYDGSISISNIRIDTNADDAADLYISVTSSSDITRNYITGSGGTIYLDGVDIYLDTTITSFGQITVIDTSEGLQIVGTPSVYINGELESESYWINGVISQDSISEDVKKHGLSYAAMVVMPTEAFIQDVRTIHTRLEQRRFAFSREGEWEFFAQAQTIQEDSGSGSDSKSFDYQTYGAIVGADVRIDQTTIFGMALAYDHGDAKLHHSEGHIKMDDYRFTAFGSKVFANWLFVEGGAQFGIGSYDIRRRAGSTVGDNNGDTDGVNVGGFFTFGGVVPITDNIFLTPYIGLTYMYSHVDSFDETGSYGYKADGFNANSLRGKIGTQLRTELMLGDTPTALALGLSYAHEFIDDDIDYDVAAITYSDKKQSLTENAFTEDLISIGLSAEFGVTDSASVFMGYNADIGLGNSEVSHAVNAGLKVTF